MNNKCLLLCASLLAVSSVCQCSPVEPNAQPDAQQDQGQQPKKLSPEAEMRRKYRFKRAKNKEMISMIGAFAENAKMFEMLSKGMSAAGRMTLLHNLVEIEDQLYMKIARQELAKLQQLMSVLGEAPDLIEESLENHDLHRGDNGQTSRELLHLARLNGKKQAAEVDAIQENIERLRGLVEGVHAVERSLMANLPIQLRKKILQHIEPEVKLDVDQQVDSDKN